MDASIKCFCCDAGIINGNHKKVDGEIICLECHEKIEGGKIFVYCGTCGGGRIFTRNCKKAIHALLTVNSTTKDGCYDEIAFSTGLALVESTKMVLFPLKGCPACVEEIPNLRTKSSRVSHIGLPGACKIQ